MTVKITPSDWGDMLNDLFRRVAGLEQSITNPAVVHQNKFETITIGSGGDAITIVAPQAPPTALVPVVGAFYDVIYLDLSWTAPADGAAVEYEVEVAKKVGSSYELKQTRRTISTSVRVSNLEPETTYGVRVHAINRIGRYSTPLPAIGYTDITTGKDSTTPPQIANVTLVRGATSAVVKFDPSTAPDVANAHGLYMVQLSTSNTFTTVDRQVTTTAWVVAFNDLIVENTYYARVAAIDASGNQGPWSDVTSGVLAGGVNDSMVIADLSAAKIQFGEMHGDRIAANTLDADRIRTSSITAADITLAGGQFMAGSPPATGMVINSQGLRLYAGGSVTVALDAATGTGTFSGTISGSTITGSLFQTAASGRRIVVSTGTYPGGSFATLLIRGPNNGAQINMPGDAILMSTGGIVEIDSTGSYQLINSKTGVTLSARDSTASITLQFWAGNGSLLQMYRSGGVNYFDIPRGRLRAWDPASFFSSVSMGNLNAQVTDVWTLTADDVSCWSISSQTHALNDYQLRMRSMGDGNHVIYYHSGIDGIEVYGHQGVRLAGGGAPLIDARTAGIYFYLVPWGSDADVILRIAGSSQVLKHNSSITIKRDVIDLPNGGEENPVWAMRVTSFRWRHRTAEDESRMERLRPGGRSVGFIAEEMYDLAPECSTFGAEEVVEGINESGVLAYAVAGMQYLKQQVEELQAEVFKGKKPKKKEAVNIGNSSKHGSGTPEADAEGGTAGE